MNVYEFIRNEELLENIFGSLFQDVDHEASGVTPEDKNKILNGNKIRDDIWEYISIRVPASKDNDLEYNKINSAKCNVIWIFLYSKPSDSLYIRINSRYGNIRRLKLDITININDLKIHSILLPAVNFHYERFMKPFPKKEGGEWMFNFTEEEGKMTKAAR